MKKRKIKVMFSQIIEEVNALREEVAELRVALQAATTEGEAPEADGADEAHDGSAADEAPAADPDAVSTDAPSQAPAGEDTDDD